MEIEFKVKITHEELKQELYYALLTASGVIMSALLFALFFLPFSLIALLVIPCFHSYRAIRSQEKNPDVLRIEDNNLIYFTKGNKALSIPLSAISRAEYKEGIIIHLKRPLQARVLIMDPRILNKTKLGDFYFKWFEPKAFFLIESRIKTNLNNVVHSN